MYTYIYMYIYKYGCMYVHTSIYSRIVYCELGFPDCSLYDADVVVLTVDCNDFKDAWLRLFCLLDRQVVLSQRSTGIMHTSTCWAEVCWLWLTTHSHILCTMVIEWLWHIPWLQKKVWNRWTKKHLECQVYVVRICVCVCVYIYIYWCNYSNCSMNA